MERVKRSLSELCDRQKRRRIAEGVRKELLNCSERSEGFANVDGENGEDASPVATEEHIVMNEKSCSEEADCQLMFEVGSEMDEFSLYDPLDDSDRESFLCEDEIDQSPREVNSEQPVSGREEAAPTLSCKLADWAINTNTPAAHLTQLLKLLHPYLCLLCCFSSTSLASVINVCNRCTSIGSA